MFVVNLQFFFTLRFRLYIQQSQKSATGYSFSDNDTYTQFRAKNVHALFFIILLCLASILLYSFNNQNNDNSKNPYQIKHISIHVNINISYGHKTLKIIEPSVIRFEIADIKLHTTT